jgi:hypothetical protein
MEIEFRVKITQQEMRQQFYVSSLFSGTAILLSIFISLFIPVLSFFLLGVGFLTAYLAFKPYFKLRTQKKTPDCLTITQQRLVFSSNNKKVVSIPLRAIQNVIFDEGIVLYLKKPILEPIEILDARWLKNKKSGDFFFEWFEPNVFAILTQELRPN